MRYLYAAIAGLLAQAAHGQVVADSVLADSVVYPVVVDTRWVSSQVDSAGICTEILHWSGPGGLVRTFYPSGRLKDYIPYANLWAGRVHGVATSWYDNGQLGAQQTFLQGQRDSTLVLYYENGQLKRQTRYVAGSEQIGSCFDPAGQPIPYFPYEQLPLYPGGDAELSKEITKTLRVPRQVSAQLWMPRKVDVSFLVTKEGLIQQPKVTVSSQIPALDQAVLAAIAKLARRFYPGRRDGVTVACQYHLPIVFSGRMPQRGGSGPRSTL